MGKKSKLLKKLRVDKPVKNTVFDPQAYLTDSSAFYNNAINKAKNEAWLRKQAGYDTEPVDKDIQFYTERLGKQKNKQQELIDMGYKTINKKKTGGTVKSKKSNYGKVTGMAKKRR